MPFAGLPSSLDMASRRSVHPHCSITSLAVCHCLNNNCLIAESSYLALVLAQFFVHLEVLFKLGYRPKLHHEIKNGIGVEIARIRKIEGDKRRAAEAKSD